MREFATGFLNIIMDNLHSIVPITIFLIFYYFYQNPILNKKESFRFYSYLKEGFPYGYEIYNSEGKVFYKEANVPIGSDIFILKYVYETFMYENFIIKMFRLLRKYLAREENHPTVTAKVLANHFFYDYEYLIPGFLRRITKGKYIYCLKRRIWRGKTYIGLYFDPRTKNWIFGVIAVKKKGNWILVVYNHYFTKIIGVIARKNWKYYSKTDYPMNRSLKEEEFERLLHRAVLGE